MCKEEARILADHIHNVTCNNLRAVIVLLSNIQCAIDKSGRNVANNNATRCVYTALLFLPCFFSHSPSKSLITATKKRCDRMLDTNVMHRLAARNIDKQSLCGETMDHNIPNRKGRRYIN